MTEHSIDPGVMLVMVSVGVWASAKAIVLWRSLRRPSHQRRRTLP